MKNLIYLFGIIPICLALSCKPTKVVTNIKEIVTHDTIRDTRIVERFKYVQDTLVIDNPCDSAGILTTFYSKLSAPQGTVIIRSYKGKIQATVSLDSMKQVYEARYKSFVGKNVEIREKLVVKNVIPSWIIVALFFESMIILLYLYFKFIFPK
jgi:hypothetical protein